ncbi:DUF7563 family protein [Natronosalvus amylolyticus]|uniref:DUF7563 family protein n=1 Tax=Natronosalvus amylolyticus TaxID=2961994 RepID=UPI003CCCBEB0
MVCVAVSHGGLEANSTCLHCGAHVSEQFARVFTRRGRRDHGVLILRWRERTE